MAEASNLPVVITVPTTGIKERTNFALPKWMVGLFLAVPIFALFALGGSATGECGAATELATDVVTGQIVNCDGSKFEGSSVGGGGSTDFIALGDAIYNGQEVAGVNCSGCHGAGGGGGAGPALNGVLNVFGACTDHIEWVTLATVGFQAANRATYGDTNKPVGGFGVMPSFGSALSAEQVAAVAAFERVRFGSEPPDQALADCGLVAPPGGATGDSPAPGSEPDADGDEVPPPQTGDSAP
jgi:mono/diheme cytochrome c family protein